MGSLPIKNSDAERAAQNLAAAILNGDSSAPKLMRQALGGLARWEAVVFRNRVWSLVELSK